MNKINDGYRHFDHEKFAQSKNPLDFWGQIRRTVNGRSVSEKQISFIVESITEALELKKTDSVLDLACGNGALSARLFKLCKALHGVDLSEFLVTTAKNHFETLPDYTFSESDLVSFMEADPNPLRYTKALCYGSFSYLSEIAANEALCLLRRRYENVELIFIGNLPDINLRHRFFKKSTPPDKDLKEHTTAIGIWRSEDEFVRIARDAGWRVRITRMDRDFYSASYRFDAILER